MEIAGTDALTGGKEVGFLKYQQYSGDRNLGEIIMEESPLHFVSALTPS